jgi:hypothetical protein
MHVGILLWNLLCMHKWHYYALLTGAQRWEGLWLSEYQLRSASLLRSRFLEALCEQSSNRFLSILGVGGAGTSGCSSKFNKFRSVNSVLQSNFTDNPKWNQLHGSGSMTVLSMGQVLQFLYLLNRLIALFCCISHISYIYISLSLYRYLGCIMLNIFIHFHTFSPIVSLRPPSPFFEVVIGCHR